MSASMMNEHEEISRVARRLWQHAGSPDGQNLDFWLQAERQAVQDMNGSSADAAPNATANEDLSEQILHVQEEERKRISRELHDEVGHALLAISLNLEALRQTTAADNEALTTKFAETHRLVQQTMDTVHRFARELLPAMLDELGLLPTLRSQLRDFATRTGLGVDFHADAEAEALGGDQKTVVFRIAQESLTNVAKHAQASRVTFSIRKTGDTIQVEISDDGKSFNEDSMESAKTRKRLGLIGMQERVGLVGGSFSIKPRAGKGTTVRVLIPCQPAVVTPPSRSGRATEVVRNTPTCAT